MKTRGWQALFPVTIFLSAFLLFSIQPISGKLLLPFFGGSSAVWTTSLLFFSTLLFVGYLYVYLLTHFFARYQATIHIAVIGFTLLLLVLERQTAWSTLLIQGGGATYVGVLITLCLSIGGPFFLLSTTGPLLQFWWGISQEREPYKLYALSNAASVLALIGYPFLVEPFASLGTQAQVWQVLFCLYVLLLSIVSISFVRLGMRHVAKRAVLSRAHLNQYLLWVGYAALPAFMLAATTNEITQILAPVPLLWIGPLAVYLFTFIFAFSGRSGGKFAPLFLLVTSVTVFVMTFLADVKVSWQLISYIVLLFACGLACHGRLYDLRPKRDALALFYLMLSLGGMLGTMMVSLLAPLLFSNFWEFPFGIAFSAIFAISILSIQFFPRILGERQVLAVRVIGICIVGVTLTSFLTPHENDPVIVSRNFYGVAKVTFRDNMSVLTHGSTIHGLQFQSREDRLLPALYYTPKSGVGRAITYERERKGNLTVGVVGLGVGTLAVYCEEKDHFVFYEIDPRIEALARTYFSYLSHCKDSEVRTGDARVLLENERAKNNPGAFDVLAIDAFSDDKIPLHLLTLQALRLYAAHLHDNQSIIAIHVSNRYIDLAPVTLRLARELNMSAMVVDNPGDMSLGESFSRWVLIAKDADIFKSVVFSYSNVEPTITPAPLWTDDYTALFPLLRTPF